MNATELWIDHPRFQTRQPSDAEKWEFIDSFRYGLLQRSNWTQLADAILTTTEKNAWDTYRATLQEIEIDYMFPEQVIFPNEPPITSTPNTPEITTSKANRAQFKIEYINTLATLEQIEGAVSPTSAQVITAVKFLAKTLRLLLKLIARMI